MCHRPHEIHRRDPRSSDNLHAEIENVYVNLIDNKMELYRAQFHRKYSG